MESDQGSTHQDAEFFACAFQSLGAPVITKTLEGVITSWNKAAERTFGYSADEVIGRHVSLLIPPERGQEETQILESVTRGEVFGEVETVRLRKDGSRIDIAVTVAPIRDQLGAIVGAVKIARELTAVRQAQRQAEHQREQTVITLASIADGIIVTDEQGRVTFINPAGEALTGWSIQEARGHPIETVFHIINEATRRRAENPIPRVLEQGVTAGLANHTLLVARDDTERAIDDSAAPIRRSDGTISGAVLVFRDVSQRRAADETRARLAAIVESSDDAIISKDLNGRIVSWNSGATRLFGYTADEMVGCHISALIPPVKLKEETDILDRIRRGERVDHFETVRLTKSGQKVDVSLTVSPVLNRDGQVIGASKIARDVSEQRRVREALQEAKESLERKVAERTSQLQEAILDLEHFSYSMSHDLRAPLRSITSYASLLLNEHPETLTPDAQKLIRKVSSSAERMDRLMNDALEYLRVARETLTLTPVQLDRVVSEVIEHSSRLQQDSATLVIEEPLGTVLGNESLLVRCISNLLGNAVKFVADGTKPSVRIYTTDAGARLRLSIQDNGIGIRESDFVRIWRIFERGSKSYEGTGIGLSLVKRAVERMSGRVGLTSEFGKGSTFWFELRKPPGKA